MMFKDQLVALGACSEAIDWVGNRAFEQAWSECERPDWLLWYAWESKDYDITLIQHTACDCAEWALQFVPEGENRPKECIETARRFIEGSVSRNELDAAWSAAWSAADAAWSAAWSAADAAWSAADERVVQYHPKATGAEMNHARAEKILSHVRPHLPECPITALELGIKLGKSGEVESIRRSVRKIVKALNEFYPERKIGANINGYFLIRDHNDRHADQEFHRNHGKGELFTARTRRHNPNQQTVACK